MSQKTKCYKDTVVLTQWGALGEVSELSYKSLLIISSKRSYCRGPKGLQLEVRARRAPRLLVIQYFNVMKVAFCANLVMYKLYCVQCMLYCIIVHLCVVLYIYTVFCGTVQCSCCCYSLIWKWTGLTGKEASLGFFHKSLSHPHQRRHQQNQSRPSMELS